MEQVNEIFLHERQGPYKVHTVTVDALVMQGTGLNARNKFNNPCLDGYNILTPSGLLTVKELIYESLFQNKRQLPLIIALPLGEETH